MKFVCNDHSDQLLLTLYLLLFTFPKCLRTSWASFSCVSNFCKSNGRTRISWSFLNDEPWAREIADGKEIVRSSSAYKKSLLPNVLRQNLDFKGLQGMGFFLNISLPILATGQAVFLLLLYRPEHNLRTSSPGSSGGGMGKGRRACNCVSGIWISASRNADWRRWH